MIKERGENESVMLADWPTMDVADEKVLKAFDTAEEVITNIRNIRKQKNIANKVEIELKIKKNLEFDNSFDAVVQKIGNASVLEYVTEKAENAFSFIVNSNEYFIPFSEDIDVEAEIDKLKEELQYTKGFLASVEKKLSNEKFVSGAPEKVVEMERKKQEDAQNKIKVIEEKLSSFA